MRSGLSFEQIQDIINAQAVDTIRNAKGGLRKNGRRIQVYFNYQTTDSSKPSGKRQVRVTRQTDIDAKKLSDDPYKAGHKQFNALVNAFRDDILEDVKSIRGVQSDPTATVGEVMESYITYKLEMGKATGEMGHGRGIRDTTGFSMRRQANRLKRYPIYDTPLTDVTPTSVQSVVNDMCKTLSGASVQGTISVLRQACRWCLGKRADLPTDGVVLPSVRRKAGGVEEDTDEDGNTIPRGRKNIVRRSDIPRIISTCAEMRGSLRSTGTAAILCLSCGLRIGEVSALQWRNVHLEADTPYIRVMHSCNVIHDTEGHISYVVGKTKSKSSVRNVAIPRNIVPILRTRRAEMLEALLAQDVPEGESKPSISELFVCGDETGAMRGVNALGSSWRAYCKRYNITGDRGETLSCHQLRDSFASALIDDGVPVLRVSHMLGHETIDITLKRYIFGNDADAFESIEKHGDIFDITLANGTNG